MVRQTKLSDGTSIPSLGWGNMGGKAKALSAGAVALKAGIHHIDSAQVYGTEVEVGGAIKAAGLKRDDVYVTTKLINLPEKHAEAKDIKAAVQRSLDKLEFIPNLLLIHNPHIPGKAGVGLGEFWTHLEGLVQDGTLKGCSLGLSNFRPADIDEVMKVAKIKPVVNQIEYHPYVSVHLQPLLAAQSKHSIVTQAYASLAPINRHPTGGPLKPVLTELAKTLSSESGEEIDEAGVLMLWIMAKGAVVITSSSDTKRIHGMAAVEKVRDLTPAEVKRIDGEGEKVHFRHWTEHLTTDFPAPKLPEDV